MSYGLLDAVRKRVGDVGEDPKRAGDKYYELAELGEQTKFDEKTETFIKDWHGIIRLGLEITRDVGLHLRVIAQVSEAIVWVGGYPGVAEVCDAWTLILNEAWDDVHPTRARARTGAGQQITLKLESWLGDRQHLPESDEGLLEADRALNAFSDAIDTRMPKVSNLPQSREVVGWFANEARSKAKEVERAAEEQAARAKQQAEAQAAAEKRAREAAEAQAARQKQAAEQAAAAAAAAPATPVQHTPSPTASAASSPSASPTPTTTTTAPATPVSLPSASIAAAPVDAASMSKISEWLRKNRNPMLEMATTWKKIAPGRPEPYRLERDLRWGPLSAPGRPQLTVQRVPDAHRLEHLAKNKDWEALRQAADGGWSRFLYWITPHRHLATALEQLGHTEAARAVQQCAADLWKRMPGLADVTYMSNLPGPRPDGSIGRPDPVPAVDAATKSWLERGPSSGRRAPRAATPIAIPTAGEGEAIDPGQIPALLQHTASPRQRAAHLCTYARSLLDEGRAEEALPMLEGLAARLSEHDLERWDSSLAARVLSALWDAKSATGAEASDLREVAMRAARLGHLVGGV